MSKKQRKYREHWYSGITDAIRMYIPGNSIYHTMPARRARIGTLFILPFIIGFIFFMINPLILSMRMSLSEVRLVPGSGFTMTWNNFSERSEAGSRKRFYDDLEQFQQLSLRNGDRSEFQPVPG